MSARDTSRVTLRRGQERAAILLASLAMAAVLALTLTPKDTLGFLSATPAHAYDGLPVEEPAR
ncbi:hypothetical protein M3484_01625 [Pseudomonas sp. GX19020]|uniref:hypothetical protein n=1 Tax=Pseudomonas sp. GX19020 TaxID=2942277 RepID=UPI002018B7BA|nr:hypothetical protein [Pseudomonas sp. GX19020]MCL4065274.1 hypothetical protein [Pseudomonas sp. GX19020]